jgi:hypothetical protein
MLDFWFGQVVQLAKTEGITPAERASLDGSFVAANASRHRLLNEDQVNIRLEKLREMCRLDKEGRDSGEVPAWMAKTPRTRIEQMRRYEQAQARLKEFQAANQRQNPARRRRREKIVVSATDPVAALGLDKQKVFRPLYNVQLFRDLDSLLTLGFGVFAQNTDGGTLKPMVWHVHNDYGLRLSDLACDATYVTGCNLSTCAEQMVTIYGPWQENDYSSGKNGKKKQKRKMIPKERFTWLPEEKQYQCPQGCRLFWIGQEKRTQADGEIQVVHRYRCSPADCQRCSQVDSCTTNPARGRSVRRSEHEELIEAHRARMATEEAKAIYRLRKQTVELSYADMKENRGLRTFSGRGLIRAWIEVGLTELVHNLLIVAREIEIRQNRIRAGERSHQEAC